MIRGPLTTRSDSIEEDRRVYLDITLNTISSSLRQTLRTDQADTHGDNDFVNEWNTHARILRDSSKFLTHHLHDTRNALQKKQDVSTAVALLDAEQCLMNRKRVVLTTEEEEDGQRQTKTSRDLATLDYSVEQLRRMGNALIHGLPLGSDVGYVDADTKTVNGLPDYDTGVLARSDHSGLNDAARVFTRFGFPTDPFNSKDLVPMSNTDRNSISGVKRKIPNDEVGDEGRAPYTNDSVQVFSPPTSLLTANPAQISDILSLAKKELYRLIIPDPATTILLKSCKPCNKKKRKCTFSAASGSGAEGTVTMQSGTSAWLNQSKERGEDDNILGECDLCARSRGNPKPVCERLWDGTKMIKAVDALIQAARDDGGMKNANKGLMAGYMNIPD